jgi:hypothetical protein
MGLMTRVRAAALTVLVLLTACGAKDEGPTVVVEPPLPPVSLQPATSALPQLRITTTNGSDIVSKEVYVTGTVTLTDSAGTMLMQGPTEIRGRGNTTWELMPKKPYRVRLTTSASLLGMPASRHWVLLANYSDKTLVRNELAFEMSRMAGLAWTPRSRHVDLYLNGRYDGIYQLVEHVRVAPDRVNISTVRIADTTAAAITGGYMLEVDERRGEAFCFNSTMTRMVFCLNDPETLLQPGWAQQRAYIQGYLAKTDSAIFGADFANPVTGYAAYIDVESAINYNIVQEVTKNVDGALRFSGFMYKPRGGKLVFGPVWDFDIAFGNVNYDEADRTDGWRSRQAQWYTRLFQDPAFRARFTARWNELKAAGAIDSLEVLAYSRANYLSTVQARNFGRWPILGTYVWPNRVVTGSYPGEVNAMGQWLQARVRWMNAEIAR